VNALKFFLMSNVNILKFAILEQQAKLMGKRLPTLNYSKERLEITRGLPPLSTP